MLTKFLEKVQELILWPMKSLQELTNMSHMTQYGDIVSFK